MRSIFSKTLAIIAIGLIATVFSAQARQVSAVIETDEGGKYLLEYLAGESSPTVWTYRMTELEGSKDLSHWVLGLCMSEDAIIASSGPVVNYWSDPDPTTLVTGWKWDDFPDSFVTGKFSITLDAPAAGGSVPVGVKTKDVAVATIYGPLCISDPCLDDTTKPSWDGVVAPGAPGEGFMTIVGVQGLTKVTLDDPLTNNIELDPVDPISPSTDWSCDTLTCEFTGAPGTAPTEVTIKIVAPNQGGSFFFLEAMDECNRTMRLDPALELWSAEGIPSDFEVEQNYPNPFNPTTSIRVQLKESSTAQLVVYDMLGRIVQTLHSGVLDAGSHQFEWNGKNDAGIEMPTGMYIYRFGNGASSVSKQMLLLK